MPAALTDPARYAGYRFPTAVIHRALWLLNRFNLSLRTVQEILLERGITVSSETLREWNLKFAASIALEIKRRRVAPGTTWHLDEMRVGLRQVVCEFLGSKYDFPASIAVFTPPSTPSGSISETLEPDSHAVPEPPPAPVIA